MKYEEVDPEATITLEFDQSNPNWKDKAEGEYNLAFIRMVNQFLIHKLNSQGHLFLNEALDRLGFARLPEGQLVGWKADYDTPVLWDTLDTVHGHILVFKPEGFIWNEI